MQKNGGHPARSVVRGLFPDRGPLVTPLLVQGVTAAYLCRAKLIAVRELAGGRDSASAFHHVMVTVDWAGAALGFLILGVACLLPPQRWVEGVVAWLGRNVLIAAAGVAVMLAAMSVTAHQAYPLTMDEYAPTFQSQVFAQGRLTGQWPPQLAPLLVAPVNVDHFFVISRGTGRICSEYWPGHAMLMTPFTFIGIPWAFNPTMSACAVLLLAAAARRAFGDHAAGWAVLFAIGSPMFVAYGISFYAMTSHLTLNLLYGWLLLSPTVPRVVGAGLVGGFALTLHNPFPHFVFAVPWLVWLGLRTDRWTRLPLVGLCYAAVFLPIEVGWRHVEESIRADRPAGVVVRGAAEVGSVDEQRVAAPAATVPPPAPNIGFAEICRVARGYFTVMQLPSFSDFWKGRLAGLLRLVA